MSSLEITHDFNVVELIFIIIIFAYIGCTFETLQMFYVTNLLE